ncbi:hypothetical protein [Ornithinibacillus californiensis]|uniref:hypothetical protein n=1 Tax=Ornithinibacillus californiensis TaxID=161536 RepID=UPI00069EF3E9|nr:hypothetical protein [Ornithinibacillus californiensis]
MHIKPSAIIIGIILMVSIIGCSDDSTSQRNKDNSVNITQISAKNNYNQHFSNEAKQTLSQKEDITKVVAVNTDKLLVIAIEVPHHERFNLKKVNKDLSKEMDEKFKDLTVELTTDKKIVLELEKLEGQLRKNEISKKELKKQLKHISKLLKEQT